MSKGDVNEPALPPSLSFIRRETYEDPKGGGGRER